MAATFLNRKKNYEEALKTPELFYQQACVNYKGKIPKTEPEAGTRYTEAIARDVQEKILGQIYEFNRVQQADYTPHDFSAIQFSKVLTDGPKRREENIAYGLCLNGNENTYSQRTEPDRRLHY